ncbi:MAG: DUF86 domain-containing protein [Opitutales bacterium]|nr:DUF86 domain-containing protein [Opitutales bacterium]
MNDESVKHFYDAWSAAKAILSFTRDKSFTDYCEDDLLSSAIERKFEIIGEALNRIRKANPKDLQLLSDWPAIIGFRNILAHAYDHVEDSVVWGIVTTQLPDFIQELENIPGITEE